MKPPPDRPFQKGAVKYLILECLKNKPSYGYEIIKDLRDRFSGLYVPSPGSIYPTLQMLEEMGYVTSKEQDGKRVFTITGEGKNFLEEHGRAEEMIRERLNEWGDPEYREEMMRTLHESGRLDEMIRTEVRKLNPEKLDKIRKLLSQVYIDIENIIKE
jgi:DNA-binding PadR family transcriptional regulator